MLKWLAVLKWGIQSKLKRPSKRGHPLPWHACSLFMNCILILFLLITFSAMWMKINRFGLDLPFCKNYPNLTKILQNFHVHTKILKIMEMKEKLFGLEHRRWKREVSNLIKNQLRYWNTKGPSQAPNRFTHKCVWGNFFLLFKSFFLSGARRT